MGVANGAPTPEGLYFVNQANWGCSDTTPRTCVFGAEIPLLVWSTPWKILGGSLLLTTGPLTWVDVDVHNVDHASDFFNPFVGGKLSWDLGHGWGFGYLLGAYLDRDTPVAYSSSSLNQRFALSYTGNGWDLTANTIWGINFDQVNNDPQGSPCPRSPERACNPNFLNVDLTATKRFGKWELGPIGFYATDISTPMLATDRQSKAAIGGLVGYFSTFHDPEGRASEFYKCMARPSFTRKITAVKTRVCGRASLFPLESLRLLRNSGRSVLS